MPIVGIIYWFVFCLKYFLKLFLRLLYKQLGFFDFLYELGDSCYLMKELHFFKAQFCGPAVQGPQG